MATPMTIKLMPLPNGEHVHCVVAHHGRGRGEVLSSHRTRQEAEAALAAIPAWRRGNA